MITWMAFLVIYVTLGTFSQLCGFYSCYTLMSCITSFVAFQSNPTYWVACHVTVCLDPSFNMFLILHTCDIFTSQQKFLDHILFVLILLCGTPTHTYLISFCYYAISLYGTVESILRLLIFIGGVHNTGLVGPSRCN